MKEAASAGAKLLCFPENFSFVGGMEGDSLKIAESLDGPIMKGYCSIARYSQEFHYNLFFMLQLIFLSRVNVSL